MTFAVTGVACFAVLAFVGPIVAFISALLIRRRLQRERQKSVIYRVQGLDPPLGTRDPALLWPSVLAKPPESATVSTIISLASARSGSPLDDDSHISKRPNSMAASNSSSQSTQQSSASSEAATPRILPCGSFQGLQRPPAAVLANGAQQRQATAHVHNVDKSSSSDSNGDCRVDLSDVRCNRDQYSLAGSAAAPAGSEDGDPRSEIGVHAQWSPFSQTGMRCKVHDQITGGRQPVHAAGILPADAALHVEESSRLHALCA